MSSASEFPRCGERLEIIKQSGTSAAAVEGGRKGGGRAGRTGEWVAEDTEGRAETEGGFRTGKSNSKRQ